MTAPSPRSCSAAAPQAAACGWTCRCGHTSGWAARPGRESPRGPGPTRAHRCAASCKATGPARKWARRQHEQVGSGTDTWCKWTRGQAKPPGQGAAAVGAGVGALCLHLQP
jgi:hypothetical protein